MSARSPKVGVLVGQSHWHLQPTGLSKDEREPAGASIQRAEGPSDSLPSKSTQHVLQAHPGTSAAYARPRG